MILDFQYYSYVYEEQLLVTAEVNYKEPDPNNTVSDLDFYGGYDIILINVYDESGEPLYVSKHKQQQLDNEIRDKLNQQIRFLEIDDSRFDYLDIDNEFEREYYGQD